MKRAIQIQWVGAQVGTRALFKMEPPLESEYGPQEYVVVSALDVPDNGPCTYIFAADQDGEVLRWSELDGANGVKDLWAALRAVGYEPVLLVEPIDQSQPGLMH